MIAALVIGGVLLLAMIGVAWYGWVTLPADAQVPIHFGTGYNNFVSKRFGLIMHPAVGVVVFVITRRGHHPPLVQVVAGLHRPARHMRPAGRPGRRDQGSPYQVWDGRVGPNEPGCAGGRGSSLTGLAPGGGAACVIYGCPASPGHSRS